jgi:hypothetical protein
MPRGLFLLLFLCICKLSLASSPKKQSLLLCRQVQKVSKKIFTTSPLDAFQKWEQYCIKNKGLITSVPYAVDYGNSIDTSSYLAFNGQKIVLDDANFPLAYSANAQASGNCIPDVMEQNNIWLLPLHDDEEQAKDSLFTLQKICYERVIAAAEQGATGIIFYNNFKHNQAFYFNALDTHQKANIPVMVVAQKPSGKINQEEDKDNALGYINTDMKVQFQPARYEGFFKTIFFNQQVAATRVFVLEENNLDALVFSTCLTPYLLKDKTHNSLFIFVKKEHDLLPIDTILKVCNNPSIKTTSYCSLGSRASCYRKETQGWVLIDAVQQNESTAELNFCNALNALLDKMQITH